MDRRDFLKQLAAFGAVAGAGGWMAMPQELWAMAPKDKPQAVLAKAQGTNYAQITGEAIHTASVTEEDIARMMVGREVFFKIDKPEQHRGQAVTQIKKLKW